MNKHQTAVARNIYAIRNHFGYNQTDFAAKIGVSQVTVSKWETNGHSLSEKNAHAIMEAFSLSYDDVMSEENGFAKRVNNTQSEGWVRVPLFGRIAAGEPIEMDACENWGLIPAPIAERYPGCFLLTVEGESMNRVLPNGCHAVVDKCDEVTHSGKPYALCINGYDATIKRVRMLANGVELVPDSYDPTYKPRVFDAADPNEETVTIIGEVVYHVLPFDWEY